MSQPVYDPKKAAAKALDRSGVDAIWDLHLAAAALYRNGNERVAGLIIDIADAAERIWSQRLEENRAG